MDIEYLLFLQSVRDATGTLIPELLNFLSKLAVSEIPVMMICFVYWAFDRRAGKRLIGGLSLGLFANGLLKLTFCVYRPWVRDARVLPYGDSKVAATGYSFPSGHAAWSVSTFGGVGEWLRREGRRVLCALFWIFVALVLLSRNYLGVHTPQDVIVGLAATVLSMFAIDRIEAWTDKDPKRDFIVMAAGLALCITAAVYYQVKPYPLDYAADGSLLVDPVKMTTDAYQGIGFLAGYVVSRAIERRGFDFDIKERLPKRDRVICAILALIPFYFMLTVGISLVKALLGSAAKNVIMFFLAHFYAMVIVPALMSLWAKLRRR